MLEHKSVRTDMSTAQTQQGGTVGQGAFAKRNIGQSERVAPVTVIIVDSTLGHSKRFEEAFAAPYCLADQNATYRGTLVMMARTPTMYMNDPRGLTVGGLPASANCTLFSMGLGIFAVYASRHLTTVR